MIFLLLSLLLKKEMMEEDILNYLPTVIFRGDNL